jgi:hypothetical protein
MTKPIPKSLHTVTVLRRLAEVLARLSMPAETSPAEAVAEVLRVLGYADTPDTHELAAKAVEMLERERAS